MHLAPRRLPPHRRFEDGGGDECKKKNPARCPKVRLESGWDFNGTRNLTRAHELWGAVAPKAPASFGGPGGAAAPQYMRGGSPPTRGGVWYRHKNTGSEIEPGGKENRP